MNKNFTESRNLPSGKKLLFTDLDGTLLTSLKTVSPKMITLIKRMKAEGHEFVISSGRTLISVMKVAQANGFLLPGTLISAVNGCLVYDTATGKSLLEKRIPFPIAQDIISMAKKRGIHIQVYSDTNFYGEKDCEAASYYAKYSGMEYIAHPDFLNQLTVPTHKLLAIDLHNKPLLEDLKEEVLSKYAGRIEVLFSTDAFLEFLDITAGKGNALRQVCDIYGVPIENAIAAGDAENDVSMLEAAGLGVAMANADPSVKERADFVTTYDNDHDGLAEVIEKFILNG